MVQHHQTNGFAQQQHVRAAASALVCKRMKKVNVHHEPELA
jgi:hypothetical protein